MTAITETVREQAFLPLECDVPDGQTLREWRGRRRRSPRASFLRPWRTPPHRARRGRTPRRDRAAHEPLVRPGRPARQRHGVAGRGGVRRERLALLDDEQKRRISARLGPVVRTVAQDTRSQTRNRELALERMRARLESALIVPKKRRATKPTGASRRRRLDAKRRRGDVKRMRRPPLDEG